MRWLVLSLALLMIATALCRAAIGEPQIRISARLDPPFLVEEVEIEGLEAASKLTFNLSTYAQAVEYAAAMVNGAVVQGSVSGHLLIFDFGHPVTSAKARVVFRALNVSDTVAALAVPLPLAPLEANVANVSFTVWGIPSEPFDLVSNLNLSRGYSPDLLHYFKGAATSSAGGFEVVKARFGASGLAPAVERLVRIVVVEPGSITILDNFTLLGLAERGGADVTFTYAASLDLKSVKGLVTPYPPTLYSVSRTGNSTIVRISLIAPLKSAGDRAYVQLEFSAPLRWEGKDVEIPVFVGVGRYISEARILVKLRGAASFRELSPIREWQEGEYRVCELGIFKLLGENAKTNIRAEVTFAPHAPTRYVAVGALLAAITALAFLLHSKARRGAAAPAPVVVVASEFSTALRERVSNIRALVSAWDRYSEGKLSRQAYRQLASKLKRKEEDLKGKCKERASTEVEVRALERFDELVREILSRLSKLEEAKHDMERGALPRKEGRKVLSELRDGVEDLLGELEELASRFEA